MDGLLSAREVAKLLGVSVHTVYAWVAQGRIPVVRLGRRTLFDPARIRQWVDNSAAGTVLDPAPLRSATLAIGRASDSGDGKVAPPIAEGGADGTA